MKKNGEIWKIKGLFEMVYQLEDVRREIKKINNKEIAEHSRKFFKTAKGQYGEGDIFLGIRVPVLRKLAKKYQGIKTLEAFKMINSKYHEERLLAVLILIEHFKNGNEKKQKFIFETYLKSTKFINNWDIVDISAGNIVGAFLLERDRNVLYDLAKSRNIWERRVSIISTFYFIKKNEFQDTLKIAGILIRDKEDLIQKAVGWMLREVGKKVIEIEEKFLEAHYLKMPRTMLRYAIERFPESRRKMYLRGEV